MNQTILELDKLAYIFAKKFFTKEPLEVKKLPSGLKNTSFVISFKENEQFVLKIYAQNFLSYEEIEERSEIVKKLEESGQPVLEMVKGNNGKYCQIETFPDNNTTYFATISKYIEIPFSEMDINLETIEEVSTSLRLLHRACSKIKDTKTIRTIDIVNSVTKLINPETIDKVDSYFLSDIKRKNRKDEVKNFYVKIGNELIDYFKNRTDIFKKVVLNHGDFNLSNFLIINGTIEKIFDFDEMVNAPKEYEVAIAIYYLDYPQETYLDRLIELFIKNYYENENIKIETLKDIIMFMKYRAFYRYARYFTYYQFSEKPGGHFTKFEDIIKKIDALNLDEIYSYITS